MHPTIQDKIEPKSSPVRFAAMSAGMSSPAATVLATALRDFAQTVSPPVDVVELSPFIVSTKGDDGYRAANTLAGTRMNSSLLQTPAAISVLTKEFLDDIGAENTLDMLKFGMSSDHERTDSSGGLQQAFDVQLNIENLFKQEDLLPYSAVSPGNVVRYILPATRQNWTLRATYSF